MTFAVPAALWGLLVLPLIVLLYMLRTRRQQVPQSTLTLWQRARRDLAAQRPARRLERNLLLLLQLLAVFLLVLALARPRLALPGGAAPTVIVVDASASMQAIDERPSRFAAAVARAAEAASAAGGEVLVIAAGARPTIVAPPGDALAARAALARLRPTDGPARLDQAITLALGQGRGGARPQVQVFTDRAGAPAPGVTYHVVGSGSRNLGISRVVVEREAEGSVLVIQVVNGGREAERAPVFVTLDGRPVAERLLWVAPGATASLTLPITGSGVARITLGVDDLLAVDNTAHAMIGLPLPRVLLAGAPDRVLLQALEAIPVRVAPAQRVTAEALGAADVVVLNRTPPVDLPPGNYLLLATTAPNLPLGVEGAVAVGSALRWTGRHPVMRYVDLDGVTIGRALRLIPRGGEILAEAETPLLWAYEGEGVRAVVVGFGLDQSDLPLRVAFPILLSNAIGWLGGGDRIVQAGDTVAIPSGAADEAVVTGPDGITMTIQASGGRVILPALERAGTYTLRLGGREITLAANPVGEESVIAPLPVRGDRAEAASPDAVGLRDLWPPLLAAVLAVLLAEWWLWLRSLPRIPRWGTPPQMLRRRSSHE